MATIVIVTLGSHGHVNPALAVVEELVRAGHAVTYFTTRAFEAAVRCSGARFKEYHSLFGDDGRGLASMRDHAQFAHTMLLDESLHVFPQLENGLQGPAPDLLIYDRFCLAARFCAARLRIPNAVFCFTYASNRHFSVRKHLAMPADGPDVSQRLRELRQALAERYQISIDESREARPDRATVNIVFMPKGFHIAGETFGEDYFFVGPCLNKRLEDAHWRRFVDINVKKPRVLISLGTIFTESYEFYRQCFDTFRHTQWEVLMSVGKYVDRAALGAVPGNFYLSDHLPQLDILPHVDVFINHAGMNSTMESLFYGVPMVAVPQIPEQGVTARRIAELGLGCSLNAKSICPRELIETTEAVARDVAIRRRVKAMQADIMASGGASKAAMIIDRQLRAQRESLQDATRQDAESQQEMPWPRCPAP